MGYETHAGCACGLASKSHKGHFSMLYRNALCLVVAFLAVGLWARGDELWVRDQKESVKGEVKSEGADGVQVIVLDKKKKVPEKVTFSAGEILDIHYETVKPGALSLPGGEYRAAKKADQESRESPDAA